MNTQQKLAIRTDLIMLADRIKNAPKGRESEQVIMKLELLLKGQDAIDYEVVKIFTKDLTPSQRTEILMKLGVRSALNIIRPLALFTGILL